MSNDTETLRFEHRLVRSARQSRWSWRRTDAACGCGWYGADHDAHVAAAITRPRLEQRYA